MYGRGKRAREHNKKSEVNLSWAWASGGFGGWKLLLLRALLHETKRRKPSGYEKRCIRKSHEAPLE